MIPNRISSGLAKGLRRIEVSVTRWITPKPLSRRLSRSSDEQLDRALAGAGMNRADLFTYFKGNARHRKRMAVMMLDLRVDRRHASRLYWDDLRTADSRCADCQDVDRCIRWLKFGVCKDAATMFCPNADLFDCMARSMREPLVEKSFNEQACVSHPHL